MKTTSFSLKQLNYFDDLLTVHLSIILVINQLDAQNLVNKILYIKLVNS